MSGDGSQEIDQSRGEYCEVDMNFVIPSACASLSARLS